MLQVFFGKNVSSCSMQLYMTSHAKNIRPKKANGKTKTEPTWPKQHIKALFFEKEREVILMSTSVKTTLQWKRV